MRRVLDWLEERVGYRAALAAALDEPVAGGASFAYVFGSVLTFILINQLVTGVLLAFYYSASAQTAWASVAYVQDQVTLGWLVRGLHAHGASAMVIVCGLHLFQVALYGAYKKPREMNWLVGVAMLGLVLAFALTGYLLPWDQKGYWATKVATGIMGGTPFIGGALKEFVQGGNEYGNLTLSRFFAIHAFVLPAALVALVGFHIALFRRHGVTARWGRSPEELARTTQPFWPDQLARDLVAITVTCAALFTITGLGHGVELGAPADPASAYDARPEWYFLPLFQMLKYFHGALEQVAALGAPAVVGGVLLALPFLDRSADRSPRKRLVPLLAVTAIFGGAGALMLLALRADAADEALAERRVAADALAAKARRLALVGVPPGGGTRVYENEPFFHERRVFAERCGGCHVGKQRKGPELGPGYNGRAWIAAYLREPDAPRFFGVTKGIHKMKPVKVQVADFDALVEMVYAESGATDAQPELTARGRALFDSGPCSDCHSREAGATGDEGPNLAGRGSADHLADLIADAGSPRHFGAANEMPAFRDKLRPEELAGLAAYVVSLRDQPAPAAPSPSGAAAPSAGASAAPSADAPGH
jgi:ubiquinol-cytochrome c reductase cytochrome b subunit